MPRRRLSTSLVFYLLLFFTDLYSAQSTSNYIIDNQTTTLPLPLDTCITHNAHSIFYSCLGSTDTVFKYYFTNDTLCASTNPLITSLSNLPSSMFHCGGQTNYIVEEYYQSKESCDYYQSNDTIKTQQIATNVCYYDDTRQKYAKHSCTALFGQVSFFDDYQSCINYEDAFFYDSNTSSVANISSLEYTSSTLCSHHSPFMDFPYHSLSACVMDGVAETVHYAPSLFVTSYTLNLYHRIGLIDFYISTTDYGHHLWDKSCGPRNVGLTEWNLYALAIEGDLYFYDDNNTFCGLAVPYTYSSLEFIWIAIADADLVGTIPQTLCYLQERLTSLRIVSAPNLYGIIPECITTYHPYLDYLLFSNTSLTNIPRSIGDLLYLQDIWFVDNPFMNTTIPDSICKLLTGPYYTNIMLSNTPIHGSIPDCFFGANYSHDIAPNAKFITLEQTNINDTFPESWCNLTAAHYTIVQLIDNPFITGTIPECFTPYSIEIRDMSGLSGTVPDQLFCINGSIIFENNTNFEPTTIPDCLSDPKPHLMYLILYNSSFVGSLPRLPANSSLKWINIANNQFEGSLSEIVNFDIDNVLFFMAHKNKFHDEDISPLLRYLWTDTNITTLTISDNPQIHGTIPDEIYNKELRIFTAHNCDLHGTMPQRSHFEALTILTLYDNRLSGVLPMQMYRSFNISSVILSDNLFGTPSDDELPDWVNSPFSTAPNLYISHNRQYTGIFVVFMCYSGAFILFVRIIGAPNKAATIGNETPMPSPSLSAISPPLSPQLSPRTAATKAATKAAAKAAADDEYGFFDNIEFVLKLIGDWKLICFLILLGIFYSVTPNYYHVITIESLFSLSWYHVHDDTYSWVNWMLLLLVIVLQFVLCAVILNLNLEQINLKQSKTLKSIQMRTQQEIIKSQQIDLFRQYNSKRSLSLQSAASKRSSQKNLASLEILNIVDHHQKSNIRTKMRYKYALHVLLIMVYCVLYLIGIALVVLYVVARSLPEQNRLNLSSSASVLITHSIGLIMFINNRFITLGLVNTIAAINDFVYFYRAEWALVLRLINTILIPLIASVFLLNDCGKYWIHLWDYCNDNDLKSEFDFYTTIDYDACTQSCDTHVQLLSSSDVCYNPSVRAMDTNKCVRGFFYHWTFAIMMKLIFSIFASFIGLGWRLMRLKFAIFGKKNKLYVEGYYTSMITSLTTSVCFVSIAPLILPLNIIQIVLRTYLYRVQIDKFGLKLSTINIRNVKVYKTKQSFPVYFLWVGVFIGQNLMTLFIRWALESMIFSIIFVVCISCIDVWCGVVIKMRKAGFEEKKENHSRTVTTESVSKMNSNQICSPSGGDVPKRKAVRSATSSPLSDVVADIDGHRITAFDFQLDGGNRIDVLPEVPLTEENVSHIDDVRKLSLQANRPISKLEDRKGGDMGLQLSMMVMEMEREKETEPPRMELEDDCDILYKDSLEEIQHQYLAEEINHIEDEKDRVCMQPTISVGEKSVH
eukprot:45170_1